MTCKTFGFIYNYEPLYINPPFIMSDISEKDTLYEESQAQFDAESEEFQGEQFGPVHVPLDLRNMCIQLANNLVDSEKTPEDLKNITEKYRLMLHQFANFKD